MIITDKQEILEIVKKNGLYLQFASPDLQADKEVVLEAVKQNGLALKYADPMLRTGDKFIYRADSSDAIQVDGHIIITVALRQNILAITYITDYCWQQYIAKEISRCITEQNFRIGTILPF